MIRVCSDFKTPRGYKEFFDFAVETAKENGKSIEIRPVAYLKLDDSRCIGYCEEGGLTLAGKHPLAAATFIHEFSHLMQFLEGSHLWYAEDYSGYLKGKSISGIARLLNTPIKDFDAFLNSMLLERDCEWRALNYIKKFKIDIDQKKYAKRANCYLRYYQYMYLNRRWTGSDSIYKKPLVDLMPDTLINESDLKQIDMGLMRLYDKHLGG